PLIDLERSSYWPVPMPRRQIRGARTRSICRAGNACCHGSSRSATNGKTERFSASSGLQTSGAPHHLVVERCIGLCHPIQRKAPGAVLRGGCQPSSHFGIGDQSVDGGAERRRIFGVDEEGRVTPILTQRADVAEHQRASGCGRFEDREAKGLVPSRRCKNLRAAKTARQFRCRQKP